MTGVDAAIAVLTILVTLCWAPYRSSAASELPAELQCPDCNLILISIDTLRADRLGAYGYERDTSPNLDKLAREAIVFSDVLAQAPVTAPSHRSILSGRYVHQHKNNLRRVSVLPQILKKRGYRTAAFVDGGQMGERFRLTKGFESYFSTGAAHARDAKKSGLDVINPKLTAWLKKNSKKKFFLFVHTYDVHCPYTPPEPYFSMFIEKDFKPSFELKGKCGFKYFRELGLTPRDTKYISDLYDGGIRYMDTKLEEFFATLRQLDLDQNTIIMITSDHGESLGERGLIGHNRLYDVQLKIPWIIKLPSSKHLVVDTPAQSIDLLPTALEMLQVAVQEEFPGKNLSSLLASRGNPERQRMAETGKANGATFRLNKKWSLMIRDGKPTALYALETDKTEEKNLIQQEEATARAIYKVYESKNLSGEEIKDLPDDLDAETIKQLKALGYLH